ncbi:LysM peptidoglycan-binding domain-containing protein [Marivirga aurantiaca]|uniref:LysM peptidoglycan-binding domain-containing protein n=1 Tax=Marivirga aurantiaca TaxID=2802615 RepID=UPI0019175066|nr:LysM peptidoglycan-binding domain-containing protein [Marivirga aurantiaca]
MKYLLFLFLLVASLQTKAAIDSLGIKTIDGKKYILHKVEAKETLYSIARRYHVSVTEITNANESEKDGLNIDQIGRILRVPYKPEEFKAPLRNTSSKKDKSEPTKHKVVAGETLYSLSRKYNVTTDQLKEWNEMETNDLSIGREIWVMKPGGDQEQVPVANVKSKKEDTTKNTIEHTVDFGETIYSISKKYDVAQKDIMAWNRLKDANIAVGQRLIIKGGKQLAQEEAVEQNKNSQQLSVQTFHIAKADDSYKSIANMYGLKASDLKKWNTFKDPFKGGEVVKIVGPEIAKEKSPAPEKEEISEDQENVHVVVSGETIFSLSDKYDVNMEDLRKWNNMKNYQLSVGQKLYISNPDSMAFVSGNKDTTEIEENNASEPNGDEQMIADNPVIAENVQKQDTKAYFTVEAEDVPKIEKVKEIGIAEVIAGSDGTEKYLALHRTAKIGTIMQVRNDLNDQIVFVRVLGKLPNTGVDDKVIIRISKKAFEKLGGVDYKFPVEISYLPLKD